MANLDRFMDEALRMAKRAGEEKRRERETLAKMSKSSVKNDKKARRWDTKKAREHEKEMLKLENKMGGSGGTSGSSGGRSGGLEADKLVDVRRDAMNDAYDEIMATADPLSGNVQNPHYLGPDGEPVEGQPQFLDQAGVQNLIDRRSSELLQNYTGGLNTPGAMGGQQQQGAESEVPQAKGFSSLGSFRADSDVDQNYKQNLIRSMVNAEGQPIDAGSPEGFKKFTLSGAGIQEPNVPANSILNRSRSAQGSYPPVASQQGQGPASLATQNMVQQAQQRPSPGSTGIQGGYRFMKPAMNYGRKKIQDFKDLMSLQGDLRPDQTQAAMSKVQAGKTQTKKNKKSPSYTYDQIKKQRGNKPIDKAFNLYSPY